MVSQIIRTTENNEAQRLDIVRDNVCIICQHIYTCIGFLEEILVLVQSYSLWML